MAGRLEGTYAFLRDYLPEARTHGRFLDQIDWATKQRRQPFTQRLQSPEMIEAPRREAGARPHRQVHVGRIGRVVTGNRAKQRDRLNACRPELRLMRPQHRQQLGARW